MKFVGISGPIASGKSYLASLMVQYFNIYDTQAVIIPFASGLKYLAELEYNPHAYTLAYEYFQFLGYSQAVAFKGAVELMNAFSIYPSTEGVKNRRLLQYIGTELGRQMIHNDIWIQAVKRQVEDAATLGLHYDYVLCDDLRFVNESHFVDFHVAISVEGKRNAAIYTQHTQKFPPSYIQNNHQSEQERSFLRTPDFIIDIEPSNAQVMYVVQRIMQS